MTKHRLSMKLEDIDKPRLAHNRHRVSKKDIEEYYKITENDEQEEEWNT